MDPIIMANFLSRLRIFSSPLLLLFVIIIIVIIIIIIIFLLQQRCDSPHRTLASSTVRLHTPLSPAQVVSYSGVYFAVSPRRNYLGGNFRGRRSNIQTTNS
jgi:hypothetical protein